MEGTLLHFGMGARTCIGKNISLLEVYKLVPAVLRNFEVCDEHFDWERFGVGGMCHAKVTVGQTGRSTKGVDAA